MKFTSSYRTWGRGIGAVQSAAGSVIANPIVENIFVSCEDDKVNFIGTNLNLTIKCMGEAKVEEPGSVVIPKDVITKVVRDMPAEDVVFTENDGFIHIQCGEFNGKLRGQSGDLFPPFMAVDEGEEVTMGIEVLKEIIRKTNFVTSPEKSRYELNGVKFHKREEGLYCVATDGRRMALYIFKGDNLSTKEVSAIIPSGTLNEVQHSLPDEGEVQLVFQERRIQITCSDTVLVSNLLHDKFPQYDRIIPPEGDIKVRANRDEMLAGVRRASNFASSETGRFLLFVKTGKMELFGERTELGGEGRDVVNCEYEGEELELRYNYRYLIDFLRSVESEKIEISIWDPSRPAIIRELGNENYLYVLMPMKKPEAEEE